MCIAPDWNCVAHITLLNEDPLLSASLSFKLPAAPEKLRVGRREGSSCPDVCLSGSGLSVNHCYLQLQQQQQEQEQEGEAAAATAAAAVLVVEDGAANTFVNGKETDKGQQITLNSGDRILIGQNYIFLVFLPTEGGYSRSSLLQHFTFERCLQEATLLQQETVEGLAQTQQQIEKETLRRSQYKQKLQEAQLAIQKQKEVK